jgi:flagellar basal body-associated protein FliL
MASFPQQPAPRRSQPTQRGHLHHAPKPTNWVLWILLVIILVAGISVVAWRLNYQEKFQKADDKIMALLESADELIIANRDVEAEALVQQGIGLIPGDDRCQKVIDRIDAKRQMIHQRNAEVSNAILAQAEELTKTDIVMAIEAFNKIVADNLLTPEALTNAKARIASLKGVVCSLRIPENWPNEAVLTRWRSSTDREWFRKGHHARQTRSQNHPLWFQRPTSDGVGFSQCGSSCASRNCMEGPWNQGIRQEHASRSRSLVERRRHSKSDTL